MVKDRLTIVVNTCFCFCFVFLAGQSPFLVLGIAYKFKNNKKKYQKIPNAAMPSTLFLKCGIKWLERIIMCEISWMMYMSRTNDLR